MIFATTRPQSARIALFRPPYDKFEAIDATWTPAQIPARGMALIWWLEDGKEQEKEFRYLHDRAWGLPLFIVLPPPMELTRALPLLPYINALNPRAVLPCAPLVSPPHLRALLSTPPRNLPGAITHYLAWRGLIPDDEIRKKIAGILSAAPEITSVSKLARRLYTSRRTLGRHFAAAGLPVPSHWLQFARLIYAVVMLHDAQAPISRIATRAGYPDGFTMSNQMKRLIGIRPSEVRRHLGWEWVTEAWISREAQNGGFDLERYRDQVGVYTASRQGQRNGA